MGGDDELPATLAGDARRAALAVRESDDLRHAGEERAVERAVGLEANEQHLGLGVVAEIRPSGDDDPVVGKDQDVLRIFE